MCHCKYIICADPAETAEYLGQTSDPAHIQCCKSSIYRRYLSGTTQQNHGVQACTRKAKRLRTQSPEAANQHAKSPPKKPNPKTRPDLVMGIPSHAHAPSSSRCERQSLQQVVGSRSNDTRDLVQHLKAGRWRVLAVLCHQLLLLSTAGYWVSSPLVHAPKYTVDEWELEGLAHPCFSFGVFSPEHWWQILQSLPYQYAQITKHSAARLATCARFFQPHWHLEVTLKSSAGSKTAQTQEDREHKTFQSGSSCQHLLKHQPTPSLQRSH